MPGVNDNLIFPVLDLIEREVNKKLMSKSTLDEATVGDPFEGIPHVVLFREDDIDPDMLTKVELIYPSNYEKHIFLMRGLNEEEIEFNRERDKHNSVPFLDYEDASGDLSDEVLDEELLETLPDPIDLHDVSDVDNEPPESEPIQDTPGTEPVPDEEPIDMYEELITPDDIYTETEYDEDEDLTTPDDEMVEEGIVGAFSTDEEDDHGHGFVNDMRIPTLPEEVDESHPEWRYYTKERLVGVRIDTYDQDKDLIEALIIRLLYNYKNDLTGTYVERIDITSEVD